VTGTWLVEAPSRYGGRSLLPGGIVPLTTTPHRTAAATEAVKRYADERAVDDPAKLQRAARIVRTALARNRMTVEELLPPTSEV